MITANHIIQIRDLQEMLSRFPEHSYVRIEFTRDMEKMERVNEDLSSALEKYNPDEETAANYSLSDFYDAIKDIYISMPEPLDSHQGIVEEVLADNTGRGGITIKCCQE